MRACAYASGGWAQADTQEQQEALIRQDRLALKTCRERHQGLKEYTLGLLKLLKEGPE